MATSGIGHGISGKGPLTMAARNKREGYPVDEIQEGDGIDPKEEAKARRSRILKGKPNYGLYRLADQICDTLIVSLANSKDELLSGFCIGTVVPSPSGTTFIVQVYSGDPDLEYDQHEVFNLLQGMKPSLRYDVANAVNKKNAPDFSFDVLPPHVQPRG